MVVHLRGVLILTVFLLICSVGTVSATAPDVSLFTPDDGNISISSNITFECNATGDAITEIGLYTDFGGDWSKYDAIYYGELSNDANTLLLCNFTSYVCSDTTGTDSGTSLLQGKIGTGAFVDGSDTLTYSTTNNIESDYGSIEMWVKSENLAGERWLFILADDNPGTDTNEVRIYTNNNNLYFEISDEYEANNRVYRDISSWSAGEWHHLGFTWDVGNDAMEIYDNANKTGNTKSINTLSYFGISGSIMYLGSSKTNSLQFNGTIDEFRISNNEKSDSDINDSYVTGLINVTSGGQIWTVNGISDGTYIWNCRGMDNVSNAGWNDTNRTLYVDVSSAPAFNSITIIPNTTDELDPDIQINVTANMTDLSGVNTSILMYRKQGTSTWSNTTMSNISLQDWRGWFTVPIVDPGTWQYTVWANDNNNNSNQTSTMSVVVEKDYSWNATPSAFGDVYIEAGQTELMGQIELNNTGEYNLYYNISSTWGDTTFNISNPNDFNVSPDNSMIINVTAIASATPYQYDVTITIECKTAQAIRQSHTTTASLISYVGGPNLLATITNNPSSVSQSQSSLAFNATVKNIGNETANDTWINWTFPGGWSNSSENTTYFAGNITAGSTMYSNVIMVISSAATAGVARVYLNTSSNETYNGSDSTLIAVSCSDDDSVCGSGCTYLTDSDCTNPGGSGSGSSGGAVGGGGRAAYYKLDITAPSRLDLFRGDVGNIEIIVKNTNNLRFSELSLSSEGYMSTLISVYSGSQNTSIEANTQIPFTMKIEVPAYMTYGEYPITFTATAYGGLNTTVDGSVTTTLFIHSIEENETIALYQEAQNALDEMSLSGIPINKVSLIIESISTYLDDWNYDKAKELSELVIEYKTLSLSAISMIGDLDNSISYAGRYGLSYPETLKLKTLSLTALAREDFQRAEERAESAVLTLAVETGAVLPILMFLETNWLLVIVSVIGGSVVIYFGRRKISMSMIERKIKNIIEENRVLERLISDIGSDYFITSKIGKDEYEQGLDEYNKKFSRNKRDEIRLSVKKMLMKSRDRKAAEKKRIDMLRKLMMDTQSRYFRHGKISETVYNSTIKEISREIADLETKTNIVFSTKAVAVSLIFLLLLPLSVGATLQQDAMNAITTAEAQIIEIGSLGYGTNYANDTLNEAKLLYSEGYYSGAQSLARKIEEIKESAIRVDQLIDEVESKLYDVRVQNIDVSDPESLFNQAIGLFSDEDFITAESLLNDAYNNLDDLEERASVERALGGGFDLVGFVSEYWVWIITFTAMFVLSFVSVRRATTKRFIKKKIKGLEKERNAVSCMIKDLQKMYFQNDKLGRTDYVNRIERYNERLVNIKKNITVMKKRL